MSRRNKIIIALVVAIVVILIILGIFWWLNKIRQQEALSGVNSNQGLQIPEVLPQASAGLPEESQSLVQGLELETTLKALAFTFAERFGSYSNEVNFSNLDDLKDLMTIKLKAWVDNYKKEKQVQIQGEQTYYGITTKALSAEITSFEEDLGRAEIIVKTRREEAKGSAINPRPFYQDLQLGLVKTGDGWKIDTADWLAQN